MPEMITTDNFAAVFTLLQNDDWSGAVVLLPEIDYGGTPEWTITGPDKLKVISETVDALLWYERETTP